MESTEYGKNATLDVRKRMSSARTRSLQLFAVVDGDSSSAIARLSANGSLHALPKIRRCTEITAVIDLPRGAADTEGTEQRSISGFIDPRVEHGDIVIAIGYLCTKESSHPTGVHL